MKCSYFWYNYIRHHLKHFTIQSNPGCCNGNTFVKSGSLVKNDQNQQMWLKIKSDPIFNWIDFFPLESSVGIYDW